MNFEYYLKLQKSGNLKSAEKGYKLLIKQNNIVNNLFASLGLIYLKTNRAKTALKFFNKELKGSCGGYSEDCSCNMIQKKICSFKNKT